MEMNNNMKMHCPLCEAQHEHVFVTLAHDPYIEEDVSIYRCDNCNCCHIIHD